MEDRLIEWLRTRACTDNPDPALLEELTIECRDICEHPDGYRWDPKTGFVAFDIELIVDGTAVVYNNAVGRLTREILALDAVRSIKFRGVPPIVMRLALEKMKYQ